MISPDLAEARLAGVQAALDLGRSLSSARGRPLPFSNFEDRSLGLLGRTTPDMLRPAARELIEAARPHTSEVCFLVSFAGSEFHAGSEFDVLLRAIDGHQTATRAVLVAVLPKFGLALLDSIPRGHETFCVLQFPGGIPDVVATLPSVESWAHHTVAWLGSRSLLERTRP